MNWSAIIMWTAIVTGILWFLLIFFYLFMMGETPDVDDEIDTIIGRKEDDDHEAI